MAAEEPQVGLDVEFRADMALAIDAAVLADLHDAVEHQHRRQRQLRIAGTEKLAAATSQKIFISETGAFLAHMGHFPCLAPAGPELILARNFPLTTVLS